MKYIYAIGTVVTIKGIDTIGVVRAVICDAAGTQYKVSYWMNGKREEIWFCPDEIEEVIS